MRSDLPCAFIISSREGLPYARALGVALTGRLAASIWNPEDSVSTYVIDALIQSADKADVAIAILTPDDVRSMRSSTSAVPRDNVVYEVGLFTGVLGRENIFLVVPNSSEAQLPSDWHGLGVVYFDDGDPDIGNALGPAANVILTNLANSRRNRRTRILRISDNPHCSELIEIADNSNETALYEYGPFNREISRRLSNWAAQSTDWPKNRITARANYWQVLADVYAEARKNIFSTCVQSFSGAVDASHGREILDAQKNNALAESTRVFIFPRGYELREEDIGLMRMSHERGIEVLVLLEDEGGAAFSERANDWVVVDDGRVVGVTKQIGEVFEAEWFYQAEGERDFYLQKRSQIREASLRVDWKSTNESALRLRGTDGEEIELAIRFFGSM